MGRVPKGTQKPREQCQRVLERSEIEHRYAVTHHNDKTKIVLSAPNYRSFIWLSLKTTETDGREQLATDYLVKHGINNEH